MDENKEALSLDSTEDSKNAEIEAQTSSFTAFETAQIESASETTEESALQETEEETSSDVGGQETEQTNTVTLEEKDENFKTEEPVKTVEPIFTDDAPQNAYPVKFVERSSGAMVNLILSVLGLLLSVLVFPGIIISVIGFVGSIKGLKVKNSQINKWGFWVGLAGIMANLFMLVSFIIFAIS